MQLLDRYLDQSVKPQRPPRFLLNDVIRYWRTMCVDFAGKEREGPEKWGLRNAKLRTARKILFAGGLLPVLECESRTKLGPNWSSQHLDRGGVYGQAGGVDEGADGQGADEVAGEAVAASRRGAVVLA